MPSRDDIETALGHLALFACTGLWFGEPDELRTLVNHIADLEAEAREKDAWEGRYRALLEEAEASRPRQIDGGDASRGAASMTVALDANGYPWLCDEGGWWRLVKDVFQGKRSELHPLLAPYTIAYTPTPKENTNE
jgi:lipoprotein|nr:MAG TPA: hypothetical protein [Caudoviricetes sp.]